MTFSRPNLKALSIAFVLASVTGAAVLLARPQPIESAVLGADWECTQTAFVLTSCAPRNLQAIPAVETSGKEAIPSRRG